jgi:hypothetical protein
MNQIMRSSARAKISALISGVILALSSAAAYAASLDVEFDADDFSNPTLITNPYWPLIPGSAFVYYAEGEDGCEVSRTTVLASTKDDFQGDYSENNFEALEVSDQEWLSEECDGEYALIEETIDWYAQDDFGNVWYLGEDTTAYDDEEECPTDSGSWEAGSDVADVGSDAEAGIIMLAEPQKGLAYQQEYYEDEAEDMAQVKRTDAKVDIELGSYEGCLKTKEWTPLERGQVEHKFYCPPDGLVLINELQGKTLRVELVGDSLDDVPPPEGGGENNFSAVGACP